MTPAPIAEIVTVLAIMVMAMAAERIIGARRFWMGVQYVGIVALVIVVAIGLWSEVTP